MSVQTAPTLPWYKHFWPWFLIAIPAVSVVGGIAMMYLAVTTNDGLVTADYYKEGRAINEVLDRDHKAAALGLTAQILLGDDSRSVRVLLNKPITGQIVLKLQHPTREGFDQHLPLHAESPLVYTAKLDKALDQPRWLIELADDAQQWRLNGVWKLNDFEPLRLVPAR
ncbi:FixH family protein [Chitinibacteraceae bacterium HSL-7]